ncbi:hypothetical protein Zmor_021922 [Zophobas morio]|uniref:Uncharacterized protein n=1 Tax=Zophobas morio TaxID=2755281 RepID=A0AA38I6P3_9CUCU|nr:hypothetical protein Zmor_021922 [Zophobas morio]
MLKKISKYFKDVLLPSSAPVERISSSGGKTLTPSRNKLDDDLNHSYCHEINPYVFLLVCRLTHRPVEAAFAKERPGSESRDGFEKDLDCETSRREYGGKWRPPSGTRLFRRVDSNDC